MQAIAERARQALGLGKDSGFVASSLEPQQKTLEELAVFADPLRRMVSNAEQFKDDTKEFLDSTSKFVLDTPFPRLWAQGSPLEPAVALHTAVPAEHAAWFDRETHETLAQNVTPAVGYALQRELIGPMKQWLLAYDVMKGTYSRLEGRRLAYDAERRHLAAAAAKAADATAAGEAQIASDEASAAGSITAAVEVAQLAEDAAAVSPILTEFEQDVEALDDGLSWLVGGALRLKALVADTAGGVSSAARGWEVPEGLLPELMPSTFGKGYEVTMTVTDAPLGAETLLGPEAPPHATTATPELTQAFSADTIGSVSSDEEMADRRAAAGKMLPSDEMVYGGGVAPPAAAHPPSGGGVTSLIKDTLVGPNPEHRTGAAAAAGSSGDSSSSSRARDAAGIPRDPDLSDQLPADDKMVYGGGVAPSEPAAAPTGRGPAAVVTEAVTGPRSESLDSDHFTDPDPDLDRDAAAAAAAGSSGEGILGKIKGTVTRMLGRSDEEDAAAAAAGSSDESDPVDPQELIQDRKSQSYSHEGVGQVEARSPDVAAAGLGTTGRHLRRARSDEGQAVPGVSLHTGLAVGPEVEIPDADKKQLSTVVLPASPTAAAAETSTATTECYVDNSSTAAAAAEDTAAGSSSSSTGGGLFAAITRTIQEGKARLMGQTNDEQEQEQQQQQEQVEEQVEEEGEDAAAAAAAAAATDEQQQQRDESDQGDATWRVDVQGAEESGAPGAPGTPEFVESSTQPTVNPAAGQEPEMQVGPVGDVAEAAPGTAHFEKGPTPPGGAAAATAGEVTGMGNDEYKDVQAGMHIGPTGPTDVVFAKGPTPPGGRVAAAAAAAAAAAEAPAGHLDDEPAAAGDGKGPDLSKILPTYENLPTGTTPAKPAGGGVGTFIRDTLLGPPKDQ